MSCSVARLSFAAAIVASAGTRLNPRDPVSVQWCGFHMRPSVASSALCCQMRWRCNPLPPLFGPMVLRGAHDNTTSVSCTVSTTAMRLSSGSADRSSPRCNDRLISRLFDKIWPTSEACHALVCYENIPLAVPDGRSSIFDVHYPSLCPEVVGFTSLFPLGANGPTLPLQMPCQSPRPRGSFSLSALETRETPRSKSSTPWFHSRLAAWHTSVRVAT